MPAVSGHGGSDTRINARRKVNGRPGKNPEKGGTALNCKEIFGAMEKNLNPDAAAGVDAVYQFNISGETGGEWSVAIRQGKCTVKEGTTDSPNCTVVTDADTWVDIVAKKISATDAFMGGKLRIKGDIGLAMKLESMFLA
jgi:putative sterol carrier protein